MKITTIDKTVADLIKEFLFVPRFQRPYDWEKEHVEQFWKDTIVENGGDYFIGSVVLYKHKDAYGIVDGQQRITTVVMMLCAIRNVFAENGMDDYASAIQSKIERVDFNNKKRFVLLTETSNPYLQGAVLSRVSSLPKEQTSDEIDAIQEAFQLLQDKIRQVVKEMPTPPDSEDSQRVEASLKMIRDRLLALKLISIELDNEDDACTIFETLNTRGKDLAISHLLKNHLSKLLKPVNTDLDHFKIKWTEFTSIFESSQVEIDIDAFLHHRWLSLDKYLTANKLFPAMKKAIDSEQAAHATMDDLLRDARLYRAIVEPSSRKWTKEETQIRTCLEALLVFRVKQPYPLVLSALRAYESKKLSKKNLHSILAAVERFHFAYTAVSSKSSSGGLSLMYASWARELSDASTESSVAAVRRDIVDSLRKKHPKLPDFIAGFAAIRYSDSYTKQKKLVQYILRNIAEYLRKPGHAVDHDGMTIEHLNPQRPSADTGISTHHTAMIGNLLWCDAKLQIELGNRSFEDKKAILVKYNLPGTDDILACAHWDDASIESRTRRLAELAYQEVWKE